MPSCIMVLLQATLHVQKFDGTAAVTTVTRLLLLPLGGPPDNGPLFSCARALPLPAGFLRPAKWLRGPAPGPPPLGPSLPPAHHSAAS